MEEQAVNTQVQQAPINPVPVSKKPNQWVIAAVILVIIVFIGSIFALLLNSQKSNSPSPSSISPTTPFQPSPAQDSTANWKTYINKKLGFQIKYPSAIFQNCSNSEDYFVLFYGNEDEKEDCASGEPSIGFTVDAIKDPLKAEEKISKFQKSYSEKCYTVTVTDIQIDGVDATKYWNLVIDTNSFECNQLEIAHARYGIHVVLKKNDITYILFYNRYDKDQIKGQILSTFKFTDQKDQVVCTQDAKLCPDGSYVSRQGPNCEFAACPQ